jgi:uncharacterized membrane protein HdeD (DUF308 family)
MVQPLGRPEDKRTVALVDLEVVRRNRGWFFALGVGFMVLGFLAMILPLVASLVTALVLGWTMALAGVFQGVHAFRNRQWGGFAWAIVSALLLVLTGILIVLFPLAGTLTLSLILGAFFLANGVVKLVRSIQHRGMPAWGWLLFDGLLSLGLGVLILAGWPSTGVWALGLLVGIDLLVGGASMILIGVGAGQIGAGPMTRARV